MHFVICKSVNNKAKRSKRVTFRVCELYLNFKKILKEVKMQERSDNTSERLFYGWMCFFFLCPNLRSFEVVRNVEFDIINSLSNSCCQ